MFCGDLKEKGKDEDKMGKSGKEKPTWMAAGALFLTLWSRLRDDRFGEIGDERTRTEVHDLLASRLFTRENTHNKHTTEKHDAQRRPSSVLTGTPGHPANQFLYLDMRD